MSKVKRIVLVLVVAAMPAVSCTNGGGGGGTDCPAGTENCPCKDDGTCDGGLICAEDFCVQGVCPEGSLDCPCYANGTCDSRNGTEMVCEEGLCVLPGIELGELGDPCDADHPCGTHEGTQLICEEGACALPAECPAGTFGCPCDGETCEGGLECVDGTCQAAAGSGIVVGNGEVRACDVLVDLSDADVQFGGNVIGVTKAADGKLAFSFTATADAALTDPVGAFVGAGDAAPDLDDLTPSKVECYDRTGQAVAAPDLEFK